jgi:hypothetical protein
MAHRSPPAADIAFLYFEGCPNAASTLGNLKSAMRELDLDPDSVTRIDVQPGSHETPFPGSPSITVDGVDLYTGTRPETSDFSCRIFEFDGRKTGEMPEEFIRSRLVAMLSGG